MRFILFIILALILLPQKVVACDCAALNSEEAQRIITQAYAIIRGEVVEQIDSVTYLIEPINVYKSDLEINFPQAVKVRGDRHNISCNEDAMTKGSVLDLILFRDTENPRSIITGNVCVSALENKLEALKRNPEFQINARELISKKCAEKGGKMITPGTLINLRTCNLPTRDSGENCRDNSQCEGSCRINSKNPISWLYFLPKIHSGICTADRLSQSKRCIPYLKDGSVINPECSNE